MSKLNIVEKVIALEGVTLFENLIPEQLARIAAIATEAHFAPGSVILDESKPIDALYVIVDGAVQLTHHGEPLSVAKQDRVLGAWFLFQDSGPSQVTAKATEDTRLLRIGREDFFELLADHTEITSAIFSHLLAQLRSRPEHVSSGGAR